MCFHHLAKWLRPFIATLFIFSTASYAADPHIAASAFTTTANKHKPSDVIQQLNNDVKKIYFFTDFRNFQGQTLTHQWSYNGWVVQSIPFVIKGHRWRVSSNKSLKPRGKGTWTVTILDEAGKIIQKNTISYNKKSTHVAQSEIKSSDKENKKEVKKEKKQSTTPKADEIQQVSKKSSKTPIEKKENQQKKEENTQESSQKTARKKENSTRKTATNSKDKEIATAEKPADKTEKMTKVEKSEEVATEKDKNETTSTQKGVTQNNTQIAEVNSSTSTVKTVIGSDSSEKDSDDHIGDCDDDEEIKSTGKQQVRDE